MALRDLPVRGDIEPVGLSGTLGRRWRKDHPDFWGRLSPLGLRRSGVSHDEAEITRSAADPEVAALIARPGATAGSAPRRARCDAAFSGAELVAEALAQAEQERGTDTSRDRAAAGLNRRRDRPRRAGAGALKSGRTWDRTRDLPRVKRALSR
jgi:hypothetical protein